MTLYRALTNDELAEISEGLTLASHLLGPGVPPDADGLQVLYDALLGDPTRPPAAVNALGFAFGQILLENRWLEWAMLLDDEFGSEISVAVVDRQLGCSPLSMIRNRLDDGEAWDLRELRDATIRRLRQLGQQAGPSPLGGPLGKT